MKQQDMFNQVQRKEIKLRGYQNETIEGARAAIVKGNKSIACILPTGSGKTTIFGKIVASYLERNQNRRAMVISHLGLLTSQTSGRFAEEWGIECGVLQANNYPGNDSKCIITTMQSCRDKSKLERLVRKMGGYSTNLQRLGIGLIIIDECHFTGAKSYQDIISYFPDAIILGFTATPFRQNKLMTNLFDAVGFTCSMQRMIDEGHLVPPRLNLTPFDTDDITDVAAKIIKIYKEKHNGQKAVAYMQTIEDAKLLRNILVDAGITSSAVTSELTGKTRDNLLADFRNGDGVDFLTTVDVLTAGFDSPNLMVGFMPYKVGSVTTYLQRVGRGLRPYEGKTGYDIYVGSESPGIEEGFWEHITKRVLNAGRDPKEYDNLEDLLDYAEMDMSKEEYTWNQEVMRMAKDARSKGMDNIYESILRREFPDELLNILIQEPLHTKKVNSKLKATKAQESMLRDRGIWSEGMTKQEASALIWAQKKADGWIPPADELVKGGKHDGKHFSQIPPMYWAILSKKFPNAPQLKQWYKYKDKINSKKA